MRIPAQLTYATIPAGLAGHDEGPGTVPSQAMPGPRRPWAFEIPQPVSPPSPGGRGGLVNVLARSAAVIAEAPPPVHQVSTFRG